MFCDRSDSVSTISTITSPILHVFQIYIHVQTDETSILTDEVDLDYRKCKDYKKQHLHTAFDGTADRSIVSN